MEVQGKGVRKSYLLFDDFDLIHYFFNFLSVDHIPVFLNFWCEDLFKLILIYKTLKSLPTVLRMGQKFCVY